MPDNFPIWIADDDKEDQFILQEYFSDQGMGDKTKYFGNGQLVLDALDALRESDSFPRLIILDLNMPIMNGTQTLLQLKRTQKFKDIPVVIYSTSSNENEKRKSLSFGAVDYLTKPMTMAEGEEIVKRFVSFI